MKYQPIIGLEIHIEQNTKSKLFCGCPADHFAKEANTQVCPVCLGLPGALPFANQQAIDSTIKFGLALGCEIARFSKFDRKHYFYPDLPKAYQISQYDLPLCKNGLFMGKRITRIHLEEDTGKLVHQTTDGKKVSLVDFNRSSVPLMEMVTEPDFSDLDELDKFLRKIQLIVRYLGISTADMEKGSMRLEANISVAPENWTELPNYKVELKNINSFRFLKKALKREIVRQTHALERGEKLTQETRGYDEQEDRTYSQRIKEGSADYRYFPEPDLPPLEISNEKVAKLKVEIPELPAAKQDRLISQYKIKANYAELLIEDRNRVDYFESAAKLAQKQNLSINNLIDLIINQKLDNKYKEPAGLVKFLYELSNKKYATGSDINSAIERVLLENKKAVADYKSGKTQVIGFLIGQVQKELKGTGKAENIRKILQEKLHKD